MSENMDKYIFDPNNPKQCKSYKLLLRIAKKDNMSFFSPEFLQYFFADEILGDRFRNELWDLPNDYDSLSFFEKVKLYEKQLSESDLDEYIESIDLERLNSNKILQYSFFKALVENSRDVQGYLKLIKRDTNQLAEYTQRIIFNEDVKYLSNNNRYTTKYDNHYLFFSKNYFKILKNNIQKSSIIITLEENMKEYLEYKNENVQPIFLKKIEDIEILLKVLEEDMSKKKLENIKKEIIPILDSINIENFYSMQEVKLNDLKDKKEIYIVGENGDGKSLLLQAITIGLVGVNHGAIFDIMQNQDKSGFLLVDSKGKKYTKSNEVYSNILAYGSSRNSHCNQKNDDLGYLTLFKKDYDLIDPIKLLQHLDYNVKANPDDKNLITVDIARGILVDILNKDIAIDVSPDYVVFKEKGSEVDFHSLSAGYKSVIIIVCDMIDRFSKKQSYTSIHEYQGIVLIDEVELHLHPKWKYEFMTKLRKIFPKVQFIVTTHSPTVILGASKEAVFYKIYKDDGIVNISNQIQNEGYTSNSLVSSPLFDLASMSSRDFNNENLNEDSYICSRVREHITQELEKADTLSDEDIDKLIQEELDKT